MTALNYGGTAVDSKKKNTEQFQLLARNRTCLNQNIHVGCLTSLATLYVIDLDLLLTSNLHSPTDSSSKENRWFFSVFCFLWNNYQSIFIDCRVGGVKLIVRCTGIDFRSPFGKSVVTSGYANETNADGWCLGWNWWSVKCLDNCGCGLS